MSFIILQNNPIKLRTGQYECPFCGRTMKGLGDIKRHIMRHTGEKPFHCEYCNYSCIQKSNLNTHIQKNHWNTYVLFWNDSKINDFFSFFCKYILVLIILQNDPIRLGRAQFGCPFCSKTMIHLVSMKRHIMIHTGEKPFSCQFEYCAYATNQKGHLQKHYMNKHPREIPFQ